MYTKIMPIELESLRQIGVIDTSSLEEEVEECQRAIDAIANDLGNFDGDIRNAKDLQLARAQEKKRAETERCTIVEKFDQAMKVIQDFVSEQAQGKMKLEKLRVKLLKAEETVEKTRVLIPV